MVAAGLAVKWDHTGMQMGGQFLQLSTLTASASLLPNQDRVTQDVPAPCCTGDLQPTR